MICLIDLLKAYQKFIKGKTAKEDVRGFMFNFEQEIFRLFSDISSGKYRHGGYEHFRIFDPKLREIDKAEVRDRIIHQLVFDYLEKIYDRTFYFHSYAARNGKGTHMAIKFLYGMICKENKGFRKNIFILKCDIKQFFATIDKDILLKIITRKEIDAEHLYLIEEIIKSFKPESRRGIPLGNLTSQIFANIYLNELDRFIKHILKIKYYIRYMDDFVILGDNENNLREISRKIEEFLDGKLNIKLHPRKIIIRKYRQGIDFLGYVILPYYRVLRTKTKKRILKKIKQKHQDLRNKLISKESFNQSLQSYFGVLKHCNEYKIKKKINEFVYVKKFE